MRRGKDRGRAQNLNTWKARRLQAVRRADAAAEQEK